MTNNNSEGLDAIIGEYEKLGQINFSTLRGWEGHLSDPFDLIKLYDRIVIDYALSREGARGKTLEDGLLGYIKGQKMNATDRVRELITTDSLTGLANERGYQRMIKTILSRATREDYKSLGKSISLIYVDVNKFKEETNDKYGHQFGSDVLRYVGEALKSYTRISDGKARIGGDEFIIVMDPFDTSSPKKFLSNLTQKINEYIQMRIRKEHPGKRSEVSVSLGMSIYGRDSNNEEELLEHADDAMYYAKLNPKKIGQATLHHHVYNPAITYIKKQDRKGRT